MIWRKISCTDVLSGEELMQIHKSSLEVLEKGGIELAHAEARKILKKNGARVEGKKVYLPGKLVEEQLAAAPGEFTLHAVSYTHLDVYKRQVQQALRGNTAVV